MHFPLVFLLSLPSVLSAAIPQDPQVIENRSPVNIIEDCSASVKVAKAVDPNPHQHYLLRQVTSTTTCPSDDTCSIGKEETVATTLSFSMVASPVEFFSAGFEVSQTVGTGETATCYGSPGDAICIYYRQAFTSYTANRLVINSCSGSKSTPFIQTSPNKDRLGSSFVCGKNAQCHNPGHQYWNNMERQNGGVPKAGGPQDWPFRNAKGKPTHAGIVPDLDEMPKPKKDDGEPKGIPSGCADFVGSCVINAKGVEHPV